MYVHVHLIFSSHKTYIHRLLCKLCTIDILFSLRYYFVISEYRGDEKGCGHVLVIDGNMKNHRDICLAREAGFAEFGGLPGRVKTGCPNMPQPKCRYCPSHAPTAFTPEGEISSTETAVQQSVQTASSKHDEQLAFITAKKTTRQNTFYQVCSTW